VICVSLFHVIVLSFRFWVWLFLWFDCLVFLYFYLQTYIEYRVQAHVIDFNFNFSYIVSEFIVLWLSSYFFLYFHQARWNEEPFLTSSFIYSKQTSLFMICNLYPSPETLFLKNCRVTCIPRDCIKIYYCIQCNDSPENRLRLYYKYFDILYVPFGLSYLLKSLHFRQRSYTKLLFQGYIMKH